MGTDELVWEDPAGGPCAAAGKRVTSAPEPDSWSTSCPGTPRAAPTSAERGREVPGRTVPGADDAGQDRVAFQDVAGETAVPDFVSDVES